MKKSEWSDEQLEHMLSQMPTIKDNRSPQKIYQHISQRKNKNKKKVWLVPTIASAAAALLLFILAPSFLNTNHSGFESAEMSRENTNMAMDKEDKETVAPEEESVGILQKTEEEDKESEASMSTFDNQQAYSVKGVSKNEVILTYGVYVGGVMFPTVVSVVVESDGQNVIEQWEKNIPVVNNIILQNPSWGIDELTVDTYFEDFSEVIKPDGSKAVKVEVEETVNTESFATAQSGEFINTIQSFRYLLEDYQHAELYQNDKQGIIIGQSGVTENHIDVEKDTKKAYLFYINEGSNYKILIPTYENFDTLEQAIEAMKEQLNQGDYQLHPPIIQSAQIESIKTNGTNVEIYFADDAKLTNNDTFIGMIEAILLTAKEFDFETVTFHGKIDQIGDIPFGEPVQVPLAPNPLPVH